MYKNSRIPEDATHCLNCQGEIVYYKNNCEQWYIWSRIEKEDLHWIKTGIIDLKQLETTGE